MAECTHGGTAYRGCPFCTIEDYRADLAAVRNALGTAETERNAWREQALSNVKVGDQYLGRVLDLESQLADLAAATARAEQAEAELVSAKELLRSYQWEIDVFKRQGVLDRRNLQTARLALVTAAIPLEALNIGNAQGAKWMALEVRIAVAEAVNAIRAALASITATEGKPTPRLDDHTAGMNEGGRGNRAE